MSRVFVLVLVVPCLLLAQEFSEEQLRASAKANAQIHAAVDHYVSTIATASNLDSSKLAGHLSDLLDSRRFEPEYSGPVFAKREEFKGKSALVIGYVLVRAGQELNESTVSLRAYTADGGRFELADTTGQDLDGCGLFLKQLKAPLPGEMWILAWGPLAGFNGNRVRMRLYAFDGATFRTVWAPSDFYDARVIVNGAGFSVERLDEERYYHVLKPPYHLRVDYILLPDGPKAVSTQSIP